MGGMAQIRQRQKMSQALRTTDMQNPFWAFSVSVYARPGVAAECLALQNTLEINVNCLLFCAWLGAEHGVILTRDDIRTIEQISSDWHQSVVRPLRAVRTKLKSSQTVEPIATLRANIARNELFAEQVEQSILFQSANAFIAKASRSKASEATCHNISDFIDSHAPGCPQGERPSTDLLLSASLEISTRENGP